MLLWPFNKYPGTDYETFNWEWVLKTVKEWVARMTEYVNDMTNAWNVMRQEWTDYQDDLNDQWQEFIDDTYKDQITEILEDHPEWVTTVMDGAITEAKINDVFLAKIINNYVTPQMFGAKADGTTDDTAALNAALTYCHENGCKLFAPEGVYIYNGALEYGNIELIGAGIGKTIFKLKDVCTVPAENRFITGFSMKPGLSDVESVIFRNFEIDGNAANNRHWTSTPYGNWQGFQDQTQSNGIRMEGADINGPESIPAEILIIDTVKIHDTIRDNISVVSNGEVYIHNVILKNSDTDHLLYVQTYTGKTFVDNIVLQGYCAGAYVQTASGVYGNIEFFDLIKNPASANATNITNSLFTTIDRSSIGEKTGTKINNVRAIIDTNDYTGNKYFLAFYISDYCEITNVLIELMNNGNFRFLDILSHSDIVGANVASVTIEGMTATSVLLAISHKTGKPIMFDDVNVQYAQQPQNMGLIEYSTSQDAEMVVMNHVVACNIWNIVRCRTAVNASNTKPVYINDSVMEVPNDTYIIDGSTAYEGFLNLNNVKVKKFRNSSARPYVRYNHVVSDDGDIKYIAQPPTESFTGDTWYYQGDLKFWNGTTWE